MKLNEEMVNGALEEFKNKVTNKKIKVHYKTASERANYNYKSVSDDNQDKEYCRNKYRNKFRGSYYTEEEFVKMTLSCKEMAIITGLEKMFGVDFWKKFNSPTEVLFFRMLCVVWNPELIDINVRFATKGPEVDFILLDIQRRIIYIIDIQGSGHDEEEDRKRASQFEQQNIRYIQLKGTAVKNNYNGVGNLFIRLITALYKEAGVVFLTEKRYKRKK